MEHNLGQKQRTLDDELIGRLHQRNRRAAYFRSIASAYLWIGGVISYFLGILSWESILGLSATVAFLVLLSLLSLWDLNRIKTIRQFDIQLVLINALETIGYTAIIHFCGGVEAAFLTPIYCALISYVGMVAPPRFSVIVTVWSVLCFGLMVSLEYYGLLIHHHTTGLGSASQIFAAQNQVMIVIIVAAMLLLMAVISAGTARRLRRARDQLRIQNFELENRVEERTADLKAANIKLQNEIQDRIHAENALRISEEKYRSILENIEDGYYEIDLNGYLSFYNQSMCRILGYSFEELTGFDSRLVTHKDHVEKAVETFQEVYKTGRPSQAADWLLKRKDGKLIYAEISITLIRDNAGEPKGFRGIARDITEKKEIQNDLIRTRDFLQNILDNSIDIISTTDLFGTLLYITPRVKEALGYEPAEIIGRKVFDFYAHGRKEALKIVQQLRKQGEVSHYELKTIHRDRHLVDINLAVSYLRDEKGKIVGMLGISRDVTEQKKLEARVHYAQKMEAIGTLAGGLAHDFNNILMGIQGHTSLMLLNIGRTNHQIGVLRNIEKLVQSGARLTAQLLGYARKGQYEPRPLDLSFLVSDTLDTFGRTRKDIVIHPDFAADLWAVEADQGQIEQVLINLLVNASEAMTDAGTLTVTLANTDHSSIKTGLFDPEPGNYVRIQISDTGGGMTPQTMERIFDPFFTTKERGRSSGLGLASVYGIIKAHNGYIDVVSQPYQGSTFSIFLPASDKAVMPITEPSINILMGQGTILVVDDEEMVLDVAVDLIKELGYTVLAAENGQRAIDIYQANQARIDLVLLDMIMPYLSGGEVFDRLRAINPRVKVLLASGYSSESGAREIMTRGCQGFIQKPFSIERLSKKIHDILYQDSERANITS